MKIINNFIGYYIMTIPSLRNWSYGVGMDYVKIIWVEQRSKQTDSEEEYRM